MAFIHCCLSIIQTFADISVTAGALAGYMWKNRAVQQSTDQLLSIAGIAVISLAMGSSKATSVDNIGKPLVHAWPATSFSNQILCVGKCRNPSILSHHGVG